MMDDDNPFAYTPPGDKDKSGKLKKTKPSKHTLKYKKMFGDDVNEVAPALVGLATRDTTISPQTYAGAIADWTSGVKGKEFISKKNE